MADRDELKEAIKNILLEHKGGDNTVTSREISNELDIDEVNSFPKTRGIIRNLVVEDQFPVASNNQGYYFIKTEEELADHIDTLDSRIINTAERKFKVQEAARLWADEIEESSDHDVL